MTVTLTIQAGCEGRAATEVGTAGRDELGGSGRNDVILALGGNDIIDSGSGNDVVDGGSGNDRLFGDLGGDRLFGGGDDDALDGGHGSPDACDGEGGGRHRDRRLRDDALGPVAPGCPGARVPVKVPDRTGTRRAPTTRVDVAASCPRSSTPTRSSCAPTAAR